MKKENRLFNLLFWCILLLIASIPIAQAENPKDTIHDEVTTSDSSRTPAADLDISGTVSYSIPAGGGTINIKADRVSNFSSTWTTGTLYLKIIASPDNIVTGTYYPLGEARLGELEPDTHFSNIDQTVTFTQPPDGTYYIFMMLVEFPDLDTVKDSVLFPNTQTWGTPLADIELGLEEPSQIASGIGNIRGWAVALDGIDRIEYSIDGVAMGILPYGGERNDIAAAYPDYPNASSSGFSAATNWAKLSAGAHTLTVTAYDNSGHSASASSTFNTAKFHLNFLANENLLSIGSTIVSSGDRSFVIRDALYDGRHYDIHFLWNKSSQKFEISHAIEQ